jgi:hypothetical protein
MTTLRRLTGLIVCGCLTWAGPARADAVWGRTINGEFHAFFLTPGHGNGDNFTTSSILKRGNRRAGSTLGLLRNILPAFVIKDSLVKSVPGPSGQSVMDFGRG